MVIYLTGFMGAGKSYVGRRLARQLELPFIDLDARIEELAGMTISEVFRKHGEGAFRDLEAQVLRTTEGVSGVYATGGGMPCFHDGMTWMNHHGTTVFLDPAEDILLERLERGRAHRPLLQSGDELRALVTQRLAERRPTYERATIQLAYDDPSTNVVGRLRKLLRPGEG